MSSVDDRIVNMRFNNKQFIQGASDSVAALEKIESSLAKTAKVGHLDKISTGVQKMSDRFNLSSIATATAVAKVTSSFMDMGKAWINGVISPIRDGGLKRALNLEKAEFQFKGIFQMMGKTAEEIGSVTKGTGLLAEAMEAANYAVTGTAYGLDEAAKLGSQFAAAGIADFKKMGDYLRGVAGAAAMTGSSYEEIGQIFKSIAGEGAVSAVRMEQFGTRGLNAWSAVAKQLGKSELDIRKMVKERKLDFETFAGAMSAAFGEHATSANKTYEGALSNLNAAWGRLGAVFQIDELERKRRLFVALTPLIDNVKNLLTPLIIAWNRWRMQSTKGLISIIEWMTKFTHAGEKEGGKWKTTSPLLIFMRQIRWTIWHIRVIKKRIQEDFVKGFKNAFKGFNTGSDGFGKAMLNMIHAVRRFFKGIREWVEGTDAISDFFTVFFTAIRAAITPFVAFGSAIKNMFSAIGDGFKQAGPGVTALMDTLRGSAKAVSDWLNEGDRLAKFFEKLSTTIGNTIGPLIATFGNLSGALSSLAVGDTEGFSNFFNDARSSFLGFVSGLLGGLSGLTTPVGFVSDIFDTLRGKVDAAKFSLDSVRDSVTKASDKFKDGASKLSGFIKGSDEAKTATEGVAKSTEVMQASLGSRDYASFADVLLAALKALGKGFVWVKNQVSDLFSGFDALDYGGVLNLIMSGMALKAIRDFTKNLGGSLGGITQSITSVLDATRSSLEAYQKSLKYESIRNIAIAVGILALSLIALSFVDGQALAKGLGAIGVLFAGLVVAVNQMSSVDDKLFDRVGIKLNLLGAAFVLFAVALLILAAAVAAFGSMEIETLMKGLGFLALTLGVMIGAVYALSKIENSVVKAAASITILSVALLLLATAVAAFGKQDEEQLARGLTHMSIALALVVGSVLALGTIGDKAKMAGASMVLVAVAINALALAVKAFGSMKPEVLSQGMFAMGVALLILVGSLILLSTFGKTVEKGAGAIILIAIAMNMLVGVITKLGTLPWDVVVTGILLMGLALGVLLLAGAIAMKVGPGLLMLGGALALIGLAFFLAGAGMLAFSTGFAVLVVTLVGGTAVIVTAIQAFIALLPGIGAGIAAAFVAFLKVLANAAPKIRNSISTIFKEFLGVIDDAIPEIASLFQTLIDTALKVIADSTGSFIKAAWNIVESFIKSAEEKVPGIADSAMKLATNFMNTISENTPNLINSAANMILTFLESIGNALNSEENLARLRNAGKNIAMGIVNGITGGLGGTAIQKVKDAANKLADKVPKTVRKLLGIASPSKVMALLGGFIAEGLALGIQKKAGLAVAETVRMANAILSVGDRAAKIAANRASQARGQSNYAAALAVEMEKTALKADRKASQLEKKADRTKNKQQKARLEREAKQARKYADKQQKLADKQSKRADRLMDKTDHAQERADFAREYALADAQGKAEMMESEVTRLANLSHEKLAESAAQAKEAERLRKKNKKASEALLKQSKKTAQEARKLAREAQDAQIEANRLYAKIQAEAATAVRDRIGQLLDERAADKKFREDEKEYEAADTAGKVAILESRATANEEKARLANEEFDNAIKRAEELADSDAEAAFRQLEIAEHQANLAIEARNQAEAERKQAAELLGHSASGIGSASNFEPSRSVLEEAAKAIDRYSQSLSQAEMAAAAGSGTTVQYVQNNYSPEALTNSQIYRQTKNLFSMEQIKMDS